MSKKQGARLLAGLSKLVEDQKRPNEEKSPPRNPKKIRICLDLTSPTAKKETAAEYFDKVLGASSLQDRFFEFQKFKKKTASSFFPLSNLTLSSLSRRNLRLNLLVWMLNTWIQLGLNPFCLPLATSLDSLLTGSLLPQSQAACYVLNSWPSTIHQFKSACCLFWDPPLHQNTHGAVVDVWTLLSKVVC